MIVKLLNGESGSALACIEAPNAAIYVAERGTIDGIAWHAEGSDFVLAVLVGRMGIAAALRAEGYEVDDSDFIESEELFEEG